MKGEDIVFDDFEMEIKLKGIKEEIDLVLSDGLHAADEELTDQYKIKIAAFINNFEEWYPISIKAILDYAKNKYEIDTNDEEIELLNIFVLYEQDDEELYGLGFGVSFDEEHGCGIKMNSDFKITEIGEEEISFG